MPSVIRQIVEMQKTSAQLRAEGKRIALVPTMGFLHDGHMSLIRKADAEADVVVVSIFVNPTQFGPEEDPDTYPRDLESDISKVAEAGGDIIFAPPSEDIYPPGFLTYVSVKSLDDVLEGKARPGHFRGVTTVVTKLFHIVRPHSAFFGQKDAQQVVVIRKMVDDLNFGIDIVVSPIVRGSNGLALSSRNVYLTEKELEQAGVIFRSLQLAARRIGEGGQQPGEVTGEMRKMITEESGGMVDYISIADNSTLEEVTNIADHKEVLVSLAVRFAKTRLIDNCVVKVNADG